MKYTKVKVSTIDFKKQAKKAGIEVYFNEYTDYYNREFKKPYVAYLREAEEFQGKSSKYVREHLKNEQGATVLEGIAYYLAKMKRPEEFYLDLPGSKVGSVSVPCLYHWYGRPWLDAYWGDGAYDFFRPLVRGSIKEIGSRKLGIPEKKVKCKHEWRWATSVEEPIQGWYYCIKCLTLRSWDSARFNYEA